MGGLIYGVGSKSMPKCQEWQINHISTPWTTILFFFLNNLFNKQLHENSLIKTGSTADVKVVEKAVNQSARYSMEVPCIIYRFTGQKKELSEHWVQYFCGTFSQDRWKFEEQQKTITDQEESSKKKKQLTVRDTLV